MYTRIFKLAPPYDGALPLPVGVLPRNSRPFLAAGSTPFCSTHFKVKSHPALGTFFGSSDVVSLRLMSGGVVRLRVGRHFRVYHVAGWFLYLYTLVSWAAYVSLQIAHMARAPSYCSFPIAFLRG